MNATVFTELRDELEADPELDDSSSEELDVFTEEDDFADDEDFAELEDFTELEEPAELEYAAASEEDSSPEDSGLSALARESDRNAAPKTKTPNRILISLN